MMKNEIKKILIDYGVEGEEYSDLEDYLCNLHAEVKRLHKEVKNLRAWKKLVAVVVQQQDGSHLREMLKELIA